MKISRRDLLFAGGLSLLRVRGLSARVLCLVRSLRMPAGQRGFSKLLNKIGFLLR